VLDSEPLDWWMHLPEKDPNSHGNRWPLNAILDVWDDAGLWDITFPSGRQGPVDSIPTYEFWRQEVQPAPPNELPSPRTLHNRLRPHCKPGETTVQALDRLSLQRKRKRQKAAKAPKGK
jgi:hypothetical protein